MMQNTIQQQQPYAPIPVSHTAVHIATPVNVVRVSGSPESYDTCMAYLACICFGFLGAHHMYLNRPLWCVVYFCTFGLFGVGWMLDICRMHWLLMDARKRARGEDVPPFSVCDGYLLLLPFGFLGLQHLYLRRPLWALVYLCTFGCLGVGWLMDFFRMPWLVADANEEASAHANVPLYFIAGRPAKCTVSDYLSLCIPLGFLGLHHFYTRRVVWGFLYAHTFGLFGVGWLVDMFRGSTLCEEGNRELRGEQPREKAFTNVEGWILCVPLGFLGLHHFYLRRPIWGCVYLCSFGLLGLGWMVDIFRMPFLVSAANSRSPPNMTTVVDISPSPSAPPSTFVYVQEGQLLPVAVPTAQYAYPLEVQSSQAPSPPHGTCLFCSELPADHALSPCNHAVACTRCAYKSASQCPACGASVHHVAPVKVV